jgi:hypothetical protein
MKITVEIPENDLADVCRFTGEKKKGPAIRKMVADTLMLRRRKEMTDRIMSGEWQFDMPSWKAQRAKERKNPWRR